MERDGKAFDFSDELATLSNTSFTPGAPLHVLLGEAEDVATFFDKYYADKDGKPGLRSAKLPKALAAEIRAIASRVRDAQSKYLRASSPKTAASTVERGTFVLSEITSALEYLFDDGQDDDDDAALAATKAAHADDPSTADALALALDDYAALATRHKKELDGLGGFDVAMITEAHALAGDLRASRTQTVSPEERTALTQRNGYLRLLEARVRRVRSAARFVFRAEPTIVREATSAYQRKRRSEVRRKAIAKAAPTAPAPTA